MLTLITPVVGGGGVQIAATVKDILQIDCKWVIECARTQRQSHKTSPQPSKLFMSTAKKKRIATVPPPVKDRIRTATAITVHNFGIAVFCYV